MNTNAQISFGGRTVTGFHLVGVGEGPTQPTWTIEFESNVPISSQQFILFSEEIHQQLHHEVISISAVDQTHFEVVLKFKDELLEPRDIIGEAEEIDGVLFTATGAYPGLPGAPKTIEKRGLSTGALFALGIASGAAVVGGVVYAVTRKKKRRKRAT